jgi:hypothetical protein
VREVDDGAGWIGVRDSGLGARRSGLAVRVVLGCR